MLSNTSAGRRLTGKAMVLAAVAIALPLTATRAIDYVDVPVPRAPEAPRAPAPAVAPLAPLALPAPIAAVAPVARVHPAAAFRIDSDDTIHSNGRTRKWSQLTPAEKAEVRSSIAKARDELARTRIDRAQIQREIREAMEEHKVDMAELRRDMAEARIEVGQAMREIDANAADIRRSGQDPEAIKAQVRASLKAVEAIDVEAITRQAMASVDPDVIEASIAAAEASIEAATEEVERIEESLEEDEDDE